MADPNDTAPDAEAAGVEAFQQPVPVVTAATKVPKGMVKVRVLPKGDGRIATGHFDAASNAFTFHKKGDHLFLAPDLAASQEDAGLVEIVSGA